MNWIKEMMELQDQADDAKEFVDTVKENLNATVYQTIIPRNVRLAEAPSHGLPINLYDPKSSGAESYRNLAKEIIERKDV